MYIHTISEQPDIILFNTNLGLSDLSLFLARVVLAIVFLVSFKNKVFDIRKFAKQNNLPLLGAYFQVLIEGLAGIMLLLGVFTQVGALLAMIAMSGSMFFHIFVWHSKYWASEGGWEYDLMIFALASLILVFGGGKIALYPDLTSGWLPFIS